MTSDLIAGFLASAALIMAIGAQNSLVLRHGIRREHVLPIVLVCAVSDALLIAAGIAGLGALIQSAPMVLDIARYGGALFLLGYAVAAARRALQPHQLAVDAHTAVPLKTALGTCLALTFLNPHVYLDTVILLGSLANERAVEGRWWFGVGAASASLVWFSALGFGARLLAPWFATPKAWRLLDAFIAVTMLALGVALLM